MNAGQDQQNRLYAVNLLNRAVNAWDARDVGIVAAVIAELEGDVVAALDRYAQEIEPFHSVAPGFVRSARDLIAQALHRPELPQPHPASASLESNLK